MNLNNKAKNLKEDADSQPKSLVPGLDFYFNAQGLMVLTAKYLLDRGYCCGNGCFHCPYKLKRP